MPIICDSCGHQFRRRRNKCRHRCRARAGADARDAWLDEPHCSIAIPQCPLEGSRALSPPSFSSLQRDDHPIDTSSTPPPVGPSPLGGEIFAELPSPPPPVNTSPLDGDLLLEPLSQFQDLDFSPPWHSPLDLDSPPYVRGDPDTPKAWLSIATQTEPWSPTRHIRKRLFDPHQCNLKTVPPAPLPASYGYGLQVDVRETRHHCDCASCVRHSLRLLKLVVHDVAPTVLGVRFVHLPLPVAVSSTAVTCIVSSGRRLSTRTHFVQLSVCIIRALSVFSPSILIPLGMLFVSASSVQ